MILDVVYNHFGPDGNYLMQFSPEYFTDRYTTDWGKAINFDGEHAGPVREFFLANAGYWIDEFHFDGLRLDATQNIYDTHPTTSWQRSPDGCGKQPVAVRPSWWRRTNRSIPNWYDRQHRVVTASMPYGTTTFTIAPWSR